MAPLTYTHTLKAGREKAMETQTVYTCQSLRKIIIYKLEKSAKKKENNKLREEKAKIWIKERKLRKQGRTVNCILVHRERTTFFCFLGKSYLQFISLTISACRNSLSES